MQTDQVQIGIYAEPRHNNSLWDTWVLWQYAHVKGKRTANEIVNSAEYQTKTEEKIRTNEYGYTRCVCWTISMVRCVR